MGRPQTTRARLRTADDSGFTLVEVIVAMMVFATIATALGYTAMGALRASNISRAEQQAIDFATQKLEDLRAIDYAALGHDLTVDTAADPRIKSCTSPRDTDRKCASWTDPTSGTIQEEYLVDGALASHSEVANTTLSNSSTYTISYYVTQPADASVNYIGAGLDFKRVTVVSTWTNGSRQRERTTSSLVTLTSRGLPVPTFKLVPQTDNCTVTLGASCVYEIELTNQGAPDSFDLAISDTGRTWSYYRDAPDGGDPANGVFGPEDVLLPSGRTPALGPTQSLTIFAEVTFGATGSYGPFVLSATSVLQPSATTATERIPNITATINDPSSTQALPGQPGTPVITAQSGSLGIAWAAPSFIGNPTLDYYQVEIKRGDQPLWSSATVVTVNNPSTSHTFTGLTNGVVYDVRVVAHNTLGYGSYSATASAAPPTVPSGNRPPSAPGTPTAAPGPDGLGSYQLKVTWAAPADLGLPLATTYRLEYRRLAEAWLSSVIAVPGNEQTIVGLPPATGYEVRVFAVNSEGDSPASTSAFVTTPTPPGAVETRCATQYTSTPFANFSLASSAYSKKSYSLTNKGSQWPASSTSPDTSTALQQGLIMSEANPGSLHLAGTDLPKYSTDLNPLLPGRVISRSSLTQSDVVGSTDYSKFADWAADVKSTEYAGSGVLSLWIARTDADTVAPLELTATLYAYLKSGKNYARSAQGSTATVTIPAGAGTPCAGPDTWALVRLQLPLSSAVRLNNSGEYLGVRVWNTGSKDFRVAYGVIGDYPASLEISGK